MSYTLLRIFLTVAGFLVSAVCLLGLMFNASLGGGLSTREAAGFQMVGVFYAMPAVAGLLAALTQPAADGAPSPPPRTG